MKLVPSLTESDVKECLIFHIAGPMCSWGESSVGNYRPTSSHPTKSAVAGILAASLGIDRNDSERQSSLYSDYQYIVVSTGQETELIDFSTVESSEEPNEERSILPPRSRELNRDKRNTILVDRRYICNGYYSVIVIPESTPRYGLRELKDALEHPHYVPYLGRKSCPLAYPMCPSVEKLDDLKTIILSKSHTPFKSDMFSDAGYPREPGALSVFSTCRLDSLGGYTQHIRRDNNPDRRSWQFYDRYEYEYQVVTE
jgi:CRISPR system Cascade subunit CasD